MSKLRIGIIGAGGRGMHSFGQTFAKKYQDTTEVVALADKNLVRAKRFSDQGPSDTKCCPCCKGK